MNIVKGKVAPSKFKEAGKTLCKLLQQGRENRIQLGSNLLEKGAEELLRARVGENLRSYVFPTQKISKLSCYPITGDSFTSWRVASIQVRHLPSPQRLGALYFLLMITFQRDGFQVTERDIPWVLTQAKYFKNRVTSPWGRKRIYNYNFSKVNVLRKGRSGLKVRKIPV